MLSKSVIAAVLTVAVATPALAEDAGKQKFSHEGYTYVYKVKETKTGQVIQGRRYPDAVAFNLSVKNGKVSGVSGGKQVAFNTEEAKGAADGAE
jgi:hypothetical protein